MPQRKPSYKAGMSVGFLATSVVAIAILLQGCSASEPPVETAPPVVEIEAPQAAEADIAASFKAHAGESWEVVVDEPQQLLTVYFSIPVGLPSYEPVAENLLAALEQVNEEKGTNFDLELRGLKEEGGELILTIIDGEIVFQ